MPIKLENKASFSSMAAELGSRGGKVSKRKPGRLRCILLAICNELDSQANHAVFRYWQAHDIAASADNSCDGTCWFKYSLFADPQSSYDLGARYEVDDKPRPWVSRPCDGDYVYSYFDGENEQTTDAPTIRSTMYRIRDAVNRLSEISTCQD